MDNCRFLFLWQGAFGESGRLCNYILHYKTELPPRSISWYVLVYLIKKIVLGKHAGNKKVQWNLSIPTPVSSVSLYYPTLISIPIWSFSMFLALCNPTPCLFRHKISLPMHVGLERFHCICQANMFAKWIILTNCWYPWGCPWFRGCLIRFKRGRCCLWLVPCILWKDARFAFYENTIQWWNEKRVYWVFMNAKNS